MEPGKIVKGNVYRVDFAGRQFRARVLDKAVAPDGWWFCEDADSGGTRVIPSDAFVATESEPPPQP
jgi:hypothetical protein